MCHVVPNDVDRLDTSSAHSHELVTLRKLERDLPQEYTAFHSVHWSRSYKKFTVFGEVDFIIVNQAGQVLAIEQKNGPLIETAEGLIKDYGDTKKNVGTQIQRSLDNIRGKFKHQNGGKIHIDYLIYCPDYRVVDLNAAGIDMARIVDAPKQQRLAAIIQEILPTAETPDSATHKLVRQFFHQTFNLVLDIHSRMAGLERRYTQQSTGLVRTIDNLEVIPFRLRVLGTAGSGKSQLAAHRYERAVLEGRKTLFLCYNHPLMAQLKEQLAPGGVINTWHGFCADVLTDQKIKPKSTIGDKNYWQEVQDMILELGRVEEWQFDVLIVDEGQDFEEMWWLLLQDNFLKEDAEILWLEDPVQNVRGIDAFRKSEYTVTYHARENYRSPLDIAKYIQAALPFEFEIGNGLGSLGVGEHKCNSPDEQKALVTDLIRGFRSRDFGNDEIVVLTVRGLDNSPFSKLKTLAGQRLRRYTGEYDNGEQQYTEGTLLFESARRFKGQQAPVVILVDLDLSAGEDLLDRQRLAFTGMTRATMRLEVVHAPRHA